MEYQEIINLLDNAPNEPTKFRTKNWVQINGDALEGYNTNSQIKFKNSMLKSSSCDYRNAYILVSGTIKIPKNEAASAQNNRKNIIIKNYFPFADCINEINNK